MLCQFTLKNYLLNVLSFLVLAIYIRFLMQYFTNQNFLFLCCSPKRLIARNMVCLCFSLCSLTSSVSTNSMGTPPVISAFLTPCTLLQTGCVAYTLHGELRACGSYFCWHFKMCHQVLFQLNFSSFLFFPHVVSVWFQLFLSTHKHILECADYNWLLVSMKTEVVDIFQFSLLLSLDFYEEDGHISWTMLPCSYKKLLRWF